MCEMFPQADLEKDSKKEDVKSHGSLEVNYCSWLLLQSRGVLCELVYRYMAHTRVAHGCLELNLLFNAAA